MSNGVPALVALLVSAVVGIASACPNCATSRAVWSEVVVQSPGLMLGTLTFAFAVVAAAIALTARLVHRSRLLFGGALLLGAGLGAFVDGIVLHKLLQWHGMLSSLVAPTDLVSSKVNMFWDGIFHLYALLATVVAMALVIREVPSAAPDMRRQVVVGGAVGGWGLFNLVEGLIDHQLIGLHHVHPGRHELDWDLGFLTFGGLLVASGAALAVPCLRDHARRRRPV